MILERGALLNNRYRIVEILGQGGMGSVYRAVDENLGVEVAVKDNLFTTEEYARQFRREAVILANLRHPNLPRVTDHFVIEGQGQYLVMDYIEGEDLRQRMDRVGLLIDDDAIVIGAAVCDALTYLDSRNPSIIHRDIKPGNVKITSQGQIFLVDFGLAKALEGTQATTTGARAMTPGYSPPEQYGTARTDQRSDIFSLGATLYAALTGAIPEDAMARAMEQCLLTPVRKRNPRVSRRLSSVIERSLEVRPEDRYQDAEEFKQALLNARSNTKRKVGIYTVAPPPEIADGPMPGAGSFVSPVPGEILPRVEPRSPTPFPISTPIEESHSRNSYPRSRRRNSRRGCWIVLVLIGLLLSSGMAVYAFNPGLTANLRQAWSFLSAVQMVATPTDNLDRADTPSPTEPLSLATSTEFIPVALETNSLLEETETPSPTETAIPTITPTPQPTLMGGGSGEIAFASDSSGTVQIHLIKADGTGLRQITSISEGACQPDWAPDGQRIVFISPCSGNQEVYPGSALFVINADGTNLIPLPTMPGGDFDPAWSPDGKQIAFTTFRDGGRPRIYLYNLEDNSMKALSDPADPYSRDSQPAWSPDGTQIAFITTRRGPSQVWIMTPDGKNQELFSHSKDSSNSHPTWSPDGQLILYTQIPFQGGLPRLAVARVEEAGLREVVIRAEQRSTPMREGRYSPDGLWVAFEGWPFGGRHDIYISTANGAGLQQLTIEIQPDFDPAWRPVFR